MAVIIQTRRDTASNWTSINPILAEGEQAYETDTLKEKVGDGITAWNSLAYKPSGGASTFIDLTDTPSTYTGQSGKKVVVNAGETALEFVEDTSSVTQTSQLTNNGADGTSTYVETDELGTVAFSNDYNDLDNLPTITGSTNLAYTPSPTNGTVTSDTGTDAILPLADGTNAGLISPAEKTKLTGIAENANNYVHPNHSGDVTSVGDGVQTIANQAVTNAKFRNSTAHTVVGRAGSGNGSVADIGLSNNTILGREGSGSVEGLSVSQVQSMIGFDTKLDKNNNIFLEESTNISTSADWNNMAIDIDNQDVSFNLVINHVVKFTVTKLKDVGIITITAGSGITLVYKNTVQQINGSKGSMAFIKPDPTTANQLIVYITN